MSDSEFLHARMNAFTRRIAAAVIDAKATRALPSITSTTLLGACAPRTHSNSKSLI